MENKIFKILHAYHPSDDVVFEKADILLYRDALILSGYEKLGKPMSSFIHYQFHDLNLPGIYSTQIQLAETYIPEAYKKAAIKNVFHCESHFVIVPQAELEGTNSYTAFAAVHSEPAEKLLIDDLDSILSREYYNYPFRVYNDLYFTFENASFYTFHHPAFEILKRKSQGRNIFFASIKSKNLEVISFRNGQLLFCNIYEVKSSEDIANCIKAALADLGMDTNSNEIYITCVQKENKDRIFESLRKTFPQFNQNSEAMFGFPSEFWDSYGDLILCN